LNNQATKTDTHDLRVPPNVKVNYFRIYKPQPCVDLALQVRSRRCRATMDLACRPLRSYPCADHERQYSRLAKVLQPMLQVGFPIPQSFQPSFEYIYALPSFSPSHPPPPPVLTAPLQAPLNKPPTDIASPTAGSNPKNSPSTPAPTTTPYQATATSANGARIKKRPRSPWA
jgi:hypothetical protein